MSHPVNKSDSEKTEQDINFGTDLAEARKARNYTVEDISRHLKIPVHTIDILESNDIEALPADTFARGYIRAYAKFLEISEEDVLEKYNRAVPSAESDELKPRSNLPGEASSQSPLVKSITMLLIIAGIATVIFGSFKYYQEKAGVMEDELVAKEQSFTGNSLDSPGENRLQIEQDEILSTDDELIEGQSEPYENIAATTEIQETADVASEVETTEIGADDTISDTSEVLSENDIIEIFAENGSWIEVRDANNSRLFYNMVPVGGSKVLVGKAPFSITMGNAKTTRVVINELEVDLTDYIRSNNTANFSVSTNGQNIIFH
jgi:cytoskeleton protein RodZ